MVNIFHFCCSSLTVLICYAASEMEKHITNENIRNIAEIEGRRAGVHLKEMVWFN